MGRVATSAWRSPKRVWSARPRSAACLYRYATAPSACGAGRYRERSKKTRTVAPFRDSRLGRRSSGQARRSRNRRHGGVSTPAAATSALREAAPWRLSREGGSRDRAPDNLVRRARYFTPNARALAHRPLARPVGHLFQRPRGVHRRKPAFFRIGSAKSGSLTRPDGWGTTPLAVHRQRPVSHHGVLGTANPFSAPLRRW